MKTSTPKPPAAQWFLVDAADQSLGRLAAKVAHILRGKHKVGFSPHQLWGDHVVIINAVNLSFSSRQLQRPYYRHTGYTGNLKKTTVEELLKKNPQKIIELAVKRMLPKNRLRSPMMKHLHVYSEAEHNHKAQKPKSITLPVSPTQ